MTAGHSKTGSRDSCTQTEKGQSQDTSKPSTPALQSMTLPGRLSSPSPVYIPDRLAGQLCLSDVSDVSMDDFCSDLLIMCLLCVDVPVFHSSTLDRRLPIQSHPQQPATPPALLSQQEVDNDMVEILI